MSSCNCCYLTCLQGSQEVDKVVWYSYLFKNFPQFVLIHTVDEEVDVFLESSCFFDDPVDVGNLISGSSTFSKSSLDIWEFSVHAGLKHCLKKFEHYFASMWNECNLCGSLNILWHCPSLGLEWPFLWPFPVASAERIAISYSRRFSSPGIEPSSPVLAGRFFTTEPPRKP